ncbi:hypothetical protein HDU88_003994 [Geranomyces variabilis]|nr:hypothetical protein HDU88_003994 [Geranomyces variabilis]
MSKALIVDDNRDLRPRPFTPPKPKPEPVLSGAQQLIPGLPSFVNAPTTLIAQAPVSAQQAMSSILMQVTQTAAAAIPSTSVPYTRRYFNQMGPNA